MRQEAIVYTQQMSTVFAEHVKTVRACLRSRHGLTYNEYTVLLAMYEAGIPVLVDPMADFLMLGRKALWTSMLALEDRGYLTKAQAQADGRAMVCELSDRGAAAVVHAEHDVDSSLDSVFMDSLPGREWEVFRGSIVRANDAVRGHAVSQTPQTMAHTVRFCSDYLVYWRVCLDRMAEVSLAGGLPFNEHRVLLLVHESGTVGSAEAARRLLMKPSGVSIYKSSLVGRGYLLEARDPFDGRRDILRATTQGRRAALSILDDLSAFVRLAHSGLDARGIAAVNAWYMRMYSNLQSNMLAK